MATEALKHRATLYYANLARETRWLDRVEALLLVTDRGIDRWFQLVCAGAQELRYSEIDAFDHVPAEASILYLMEQA